MFDDPKKELRRLEDQLLAAEQEQEQWEPQPEGELPDAGGRFLRREEVEAPQEPEEDEAAPHGQKTRVLILAAALLLEVAALLGVLAWWLLWR